MLRTPEDERVEPETDAPSPEDECIELVQCHGAAPNRSSKRMIDQGWPSDHGEAQPKLAPLR